MLGFSPLAGTPIAGSVSASNAAYVSSADPASYAITAFNATDVINAAPVNYTSSADPATYSITSNSSADYLVSNAESSSYSITAFNATDIVSGVTSYVSSADPASYSIVGFDAYDYVSTASTGGGYYDDKPKRKKKVVLHDGKLLEFSSVQEAVSYLNSVTTEYNEPKQEQKPEPVREIRVSEVKTLSEVFDSEDSKLDIINNLEFARFDEILKAYDRWLELDEEEALALLF